MQQPFSPNGSNAGEVNMINFTLLLACMVILKFYMRYEFVLLIGLVIVNIFGFIKDAISVRIVPIK